jgi:hypothetical protein
VPLNNESQLHVKRVSGGVKKINGILMDHFFAFFLSMVHTLVPTEM